MAVDVRQILDRLGIAAVNAGASDGDWIETDSAKELISYSPIDGGEIARVRLAGVAAYERVLAKSVETFERWRMEPAPKRGLIVREIGDELRRAKDDLGALVTLEMGKILAEGLGEVQEMIDVADFAVGLSRQLHGLTMHSERPGHRMYEHWNALIAAVCGDCVLWKPSHKTPLTAIAVHNICNRVLERHGWKGVFTLLMGESRELGDRLLKDGRVPLVSATGSTRMGRVVAETVGRRLGRTLLELGGNNGVIVTADANPDLMLRAALFGAVGTAGQRCTTLRRLFLDRCVAAATTERLIAAWKQIRIGDPFDGEVIMGPLVDRDAVDTMTRALERIRHEGGEVLYGGRELGGCYVEPALVRARPDMPILQEEVFAPILYLLEYGELDEAIRWHNDVPQGLSSAIFTTNLIAAETFLSHRGSDCGIANVNIGTSGAEIGGAFGGEKETGGGRESGSDAWKVYMRRQTVTINWSAELPLAQGIRFPV